MKNKKRLAVDLILTFIIVLCDLISIWTESYRKFVFIMGLLYCIILVIQIVFSVIQVRRETVPFGLLITLVFITLINNPSVNFRYIMIQNKNISIVAILIIIVLTLILVLSMLLFLSSKRTFGDFILLLAVTGLISTALVISGFMPMINYAFDTTKTIQTDVVIKKKSGEDSFLGSWFDIDYIYDVQSPENISIDQISIDSDYGLKNEGEIISIRYRKGLFATIYRVEYSKMNHD